MEVIAGALTVVAIVGLGYATRQAQSLPFYGNILIVIALAYVLFAVMAETPRAIVIESAVAIAFIAVAIAGGRGSIPRVAELVLASGLAAHGVYDLVHPALVPNPMVPAWWPLFCGVVDVLLAGWVVRLVMGDGPLSRDVESQSRSLD